MSLENCPCTCGEETCCCEGTRLPRTITLTEMQSPCNNTHTLYFNYGAEYDEEDDCYRGVVYSSINPNAIDDDGCRDAGFVSGAPPECTTESVRFDLYCQAAHPTLEGTGGWGLLLTFCDLGGTIPFRAQDPDTLYSCDPLYIEIRDDGGDLRYIVTE